MKISKIVDVTTLSAEKIAELNIGYVCDFDTKEPIKGVLVGISLNDEGKECVSCLFDPVGLDSESMAPNTLWRYTTAKSGGLVFYKDWTDPSIEAIAADLENGISDEDLNAKYEASEDSSDGIDGWWIGC